MISELLSSGALAVKLSGHNKMDVIRELVQLLDGLPDVVDLDEVQRAVELREQVMTTAVGEGLAIPHAKTDGVTKTVAAFANTAEPIAFDALDEKPVRLVFLLVGPESDNSRHIRLLSKASLLFCSSSLREKLLNAETTDELTRLINDAENALAPG